MAIHLHFSNNLEHLSQYLQKQLEAPFTSPLQPISIAIPSKIMGKWLKIDLCNKLGIVANLKFTFLESLLSTVLLQFANTHIFKEKKPIILKANQLKWLVLNTFDVLKPNSKILNYLQQSSSINYTISTAEHLAQLFLQYEYTRCTYNQQTGFRTLWLKNKPFFITDSSSQTKQQLEKEQQEIYSHIFKTNGFINTYCKSKPYHYFTLMQLFEIIKPHLNKIKIPPIYIFNITNINLGLRSIIESLSPYVDIHIYSFTPCKEYWEFIDTPNHQNHLLFQWGELGRKQTTAWNEITNWAHEPEIITSPNQIILNQIQNSLVNIDANTPITNTALDSLEIWKANSQKTEVETIHNSIHQLLQKNPSIHLNRIAILTTRMENYYPTIRYIFDRYQTENPLYLPYAISGYSIQNSYFQQAINCILNFLNYGISRSNLFEFFNNPLFQQKRQVNKYYTKLWGKLCDRFEMYHNQPQSTHSFSQGKDRYKIAEIQEELSAENDIFFELVEELQNNLSHFQNLFQKNHNQAHIILSSFLKLIYSWINTHTVEIDEKKVINHFNYQIDNLKELGFIQIKTFSQFSSIIQYILNENVTGAHFSLTGGITIAPLSHASYIAFDYVFILGMNEKLFPSNSATQIFNLQNYQEPYSLDISATSIDKYHLLQTFTSTQKKLVISYITTNYKQQELSPSICINELKKYLQTLSYDLQEKELKFDTSIKFKAKQLNSNHQYELKTTNNKWYKYENNIKQIEQLLINPLNYTFKNKHQLNSFDKQDNHQKSIPLKSENKNLNALLKNFLIEFSHNTNKKTSLKEQFSLSYQEYIQQGKSTLQPFEQVEKKYTYQEKLNPFEGFFNEGQFYQTLQLGHKQDTNTHFLFPVNIKYQSQKISVTGKLPLVLATNSDIKVLVFHFSSTNEINKLLLPALFFKLASYNSEFVKWISSRPITFQVFKPSNTKNRFSIKKINWHYTPDIKQTFIQNLTNALNHSFSSNFKLENILPILLKHDSITNDSITNFKDELLNQPIKTPLKQNFLDFFTQPNSEDLNIYVNLLQDVFNLGFDAT